MGKQHPLLALADGLLLADMPDTFAMTRLPWHATQVLDTRLSFLPSQFHSQGVSSGGGNENGVAEPGSPNQYTYQMPTGAEAMAANQQQIPLSEFTPELGFALPARGSTMSSTALVGGLGGTAFNLACPTGSTLAGIDDRGGTLINRIEALCRGMPGTRKCAATILTGQWYRACLGEIHHRPPRYRFGDRISSGGIGLTSQS